MRISFLLPLVLCATLLTSFSGTASVLIQHQDVFFKLGYGYSPQILANTKDFFITQSNCMNAHSPELAKECLTYQETYLKDKFILNFEKSAIAYSNKPIRTEVPLLVSIVNDVVYFRPCLFNQNKNQFICDDQEFPVKEQQFLVEIIRNILQTSEYKKENISACTSTAGKNAQVRNLIEMKIVAQQKGQQLGEVLSKFEEDANKKLDVELGHKKYLDERFAKYVQYIDQNIVICEKIYSFAQGFRKLLSKKDGLVHNFSGEHYPKDVPFLEVYGATLELTKNLGRNYKNYSTLEDFGEIVHSLYSGLNPESKNVDSSLFEKSFKNLTRRYSKQTEVQSPSGRWRLLLGDKRMANYGLISLSEFENRDKCGKENQEKRQIIGTPVFKKVTCQSIHGTNWRLPYGKDIEENATAIYKLLKPKDEVWIPSSSYSKNISFAGMGDCNQVFFKIQENKKAEYQHSMNINPRQIFQANYGYYSPILKASAPIVCFCPAGAACE